MDSLGLAAHSVGQTDICRQGTRHWKPWRSRGREIVSRRQVSSKAKTTPDTLIRILQPTLATGTARKWIRPRISSVSSNCCPMRPPPFRRQPIRRAIRQVPIRQVLRQVLRGV